MAESRKYLVTRKLRQIPYVREDNCFPWIEDFDQAEKLLDPTTEARLGEALGRHR